MQPLSLWILSGLVALVLWVPSVNAEDSHDWHYGSEEQRWDRHPHSWQRWHHHHHDYGRRPSWGVPQSSPWRQRDIYRAPHRERDHRHWGSWPQQQHLWHDRRTQGTNPMRPERPHGEARQPGGRMGERRR